MNDVATVESAFAYGQPTQQDFTADAMTTDGAVEQTNGDKKEPSELEKYWKTVRDNPQDFTGWTYLLQYVEQENDLESARQAFGSFFKCYPYCYGYWKKYADLEKKNGNLSRCQEVFEEGLKAIPLSVDLWCHYIAFMKSILTGEGAEEKMRPIHENSIAAAGLEFRSDRLWELYIAFETENKCPDKVMKLFDSLVKTPTQLYSHQYEKFEEFVRSSQPSEILSAEELESLKQEFVIKSKEEAEKKEGEDKAGDESASVKTPLDEGTFLRDRVMELRKVVHKANEDEVSKRWNFEEGIKRPYFHVKALEKTQLSNWKEYLDFELECGNEERIIILFERCLIACALYEEMWLKYAQYLENTKPEAARDVYCRACTIHLPRKPNILLTWTRYEERLGNYDKATEALDLMEKHFEGYLPVCLRRINLERRQGKHFEVERLFKEYLSSAKSAQVAAALASKHARYQLKILGDIAGAIKILNEAIEKDKENPRLYMQLIDVYYQGTPFNEEGVHHAFDAAINSAMPVETKAVFLRRKIELLEDLGANVSSLHTAYTELNKLGYSVTDKRKRSEEGDDPLTKRMKTEVNGAATAVDPAAAAAYGYNWPGYAQNYNYAGWNMYGQQYYNQQ